MTTATERIKLLMSSLRRIVAVGLPTAGLTVAAALALATTIGERAEQARAHVGLAHTAGPARSHLEQALALYTDLGSPTADDVRKELEALR